MAITRFFFIIIPTIKFTRVNIGRYSRPQIEKKNVKKVEKIYSRKDDPTDARYGAFITIGPGYAGYILDNR